jgi:hypothetical protein
MVSMDVYDKGKEEATEDLKNWTIENVASWLKTKGFEEDICQKFIGVSSR